MKKYLSFFRLRFIMGLQYRAAALAGVVTQFAWGFMEILVFQAFYRADASAFPMEFSALVAYVWLQQAFLALFMMWGMEPEILSSIMDGNIAYELCRPISIYNMWFARSAAKRLSGAVLRCMPILVVAVFLPYPYRMIFPTDIGIFLLFLLAMVLGALVTVAFLMFIYVLAFFTVSPQGLSILCTSVWEFFSGAIIPLPFFPERMRRIMECLPFASMQNVPLRIYSGDLAGNEMLGALALQVFWIVVLVETGKRLCRFAEKRVTVQGG